MYLVQDRIVTGFNLRIGNGTGSSYIDQGRKPM